MKSKIENGAPRRGRWSTAILVALLFACTLALFGPMQLFLSNSLEFNYNFSQLLPSLALVALGIFLLLALLLVLMPARFGLHERAVAIVFVIGALLWLQGNIIVWQYGLLNGHDIDWGKKVLFGLIDTPLWAAGLLLALWRPKVIYRRARSLSLLLLAIQVLATSFMALRQPEAPSYKKAHIDFGPQFNFSSRENIIVLVLDSFQSDLFQEIIEKYPAYKGYLKDFTYFRNNMGGYPSTYAAIPFLLTSQRYDNSKPIQSFIPEAYMSPSSIPRLLVGLGWEVDLFPLVMKTVFFDPRVISNIVVRGNLVTAPELAHLYDITLFRYLPHFLKRAVYNDQNWFLSRWEGKYGEFDSPESEGGNKPHSAFRTLRRAIRSKPHVSRRLRRLSIKLTRKSVRISPDSRFLAHFVRLAAVTTDRKVFKYYHWRGPHEPIRMNSDLQPVDLPLTRANMSELARGVLKLVHLFLEGLREMGVYDRALIFICADHGHPWGGYGVRLPAAMSGGQSRVHSIPEGVLESGIPLLLVKRPGDRGDLAIIDAPSTLGDVSATVFDRLGVAPAPAGEPLFRIPTERPRERRFLYYNWEHEDWMNRYLPPLVEYHVDGNCWLFSSWQATGRILPPGR